MNYFVIFLIIHQVELSLDIWTSANIQLKEGKSRIWFWMVLHPAKVLHKVQCLTMIQLSKRVTIWWSLNNTIKGKLVTNFRTSGIFQFLVAAPSHFSLGKSLCIWIILWRKINKTENVEVIGKWLLVFFKHFSFTHTENEKIKSGKIFSNFDQQTFTPFAELNFFMIQYFSRWR